MIRFPVFVLILFIQSVLSNSINRDAYVQSLAEVENDVLAVDSFPPVMVSYDAPSLDFAKILPEMQQKKSENDVEDSEPWNFR